MKIAQSKHSNLPSLTKETEIISVNTAGNSIIIEDIDSLELPQSVTNKRVSSWVSIDGDSICSDEESFNSFGTENQYSAKKARFSRKSVFFADASQTPDTSLVQVKEIEPLLNGVDSNKVSLFWSTKELIDIKIEAKMMQSVDSDVQDYIESYQLMHDNFCKEPTSDRTTLTRVQEYPIVLDGLVDSYRGLEKFSRWQVNRQRHVRNFVKSVVSAQQNLDFASQVVSMSKPSVMWAHVLGVAEHLAVLDN